MKICFRHMMTMIWMCNLRQLVFGFILLTASCMLYIYSMANYSREFETSTKSVVVLERMFHHRKKDLQERKRKFTQSLDQETTEIPELVSQTIPQAISTSTFNTSIHNVEDKLKFNAENWKKKSGKQKKNNILSIPVPDLSILAPDLSIPGLIQQHSTFNTKEVAEDLNSNKLEEEETPSYNSSSSVSPLGNSSSGKSLRTKTILLWYIPFNDRIMVSEFINGDWVANNNGFTIDSQTCGRCKITYDRKVVSKSDAVVFHAVDMDSNDLPLKRLSKQSYVWWMAESSSTMRDVSYPNLHHYFNLTMTVRRSSDIHTPYNSFQWLLKMLWKKKRGKDLVRMVAEMREVYLTPDEMKKYIEDDLPPQSRKIIVPAGLDAEVAEILAKKNRFVAWVVSNCQNTPSSQLRHDYVYKLEQEGLNVDQFGQCNEMMFPVESRFDPTFYETLGKYKFYFSFENSIHCKGYITEKLWLNALYSGAVPIIFGPHPRDVAAVLPPKSYIHVEDFTSPAELVKYIKYLDKNVTAFAEYLKWRSWIRVLDSNGDYKVSAQSEKLMNSFLSNERTLIKKYLKPRAVGFCKLCKMLHTVRKKNHVIDDVGEWWQHNERQECLDVSSASKIMKVEDFYDP